MGGDVARGLAGMLLSYMLGRYWVGTASGAREYIYMTCM